MLRTKSRWWIRVLPVAGHRMIQKVGQRFMKRQFFGSGVGDSGTLTVSLSSDVRVSSRIEDVRRGGSDWNRVPTTGFEERGGPSAEATSSVGDSEGGKVVYRSGRTDLMTIVGSDDKQVQELGYLNLESSQRTGGDAMVNVQWESSVVFTTR
ncbi:hypothetical protein NE237_033037 [Protea cynaroides]|uniref:Uncharacterized protein n=1 Tax=Protea cynaroides TaxID=273540 RepID=A0A9Q0R492_9MAGN|nr:hypothetical protein NE237_033037 [Protea cynaroides]